MMLSCVHSLSWVSSFSLLFLCSGPRAPVQSRFRGVVHKLETMLQDRETSMDNMREFKVFLRKKDSPDVPIKDFSALVLTSSSWPPFPVHPMTPPQEVGICQQIFKDFYQSKAKNRCAPGSSLMNDFFRS